MPTLFLHALIAILSLITGRSCMSPHALIRQLAYARATSSWLAATAYRDPSQDDSRASWSAVGSSPM